MGGVTHLLLLLWVGVTVSTAVDLQKRIIGGTRCRDDERRYHVKLLDNNNNFVCGGSLITDQWVLTAAHCKGGVKKAVVGVHPGPGQTLKKQKTHTYWKIFTKHDIMLLKLDESTDIQPVNLPDCANRPRPNVHQVQVAGHGSSFGCEFCSAYEPRSIDLQCVDINVVDCPWLTDPALNPKPHDHRFCGGTNQVEDICRGDSGGGVVHKGMIYGVHSASGRTKMCSIPAQFMDVCAYMDWITETIAEQTGCFGCLG